MDKINNDNDNKNNTDKKNNNNNNFLKLPIDCNKKSFMQPNYNFNN